MPTANSPRVIDRDDLKALKFLWEDILGDLRRTKERIDSEIRSYPTPIPRCDAQFNHLYEQRARLERELDRASGKRLEREDYVGLMERFVASAPYTDEPAERELRARTRAALAAAREPVPAGT